LLLVDNLIKGFDLYNYPRTSPTETFTIARDKAYIHEGIFLENMDSIACGSDHGKIYLYSMETTKQLQTLKHGPKTSVVQVLDASISSFPNLIASDFRVRHVQLPNAIWLQVVAVTKNLAFVFGRRRSVLDFQVGD
jgi:hypothetical protein